MSRTAHTALVAALRSFIELADEHHGFGGIGRADSIDSEGVAYPSQRLADAIESARAAIRLAEDSTTTVSGGGLTDAPAFGTDALMDQAMKRGDK